MTWEKFGNGNMGETTSFAWHGTPFVSIEMFYFIFLCLFYYFILLPPPTFTWVISQIIFFSDYSQMQLSSAVLLRYTIT